MLPRDLAEAADEAGAPLVETLHHDQVDRQIGHQLRLRPYGCKNLFVVFHPFDRDVDIGNLAEAFGMDQRPPLVNPPGPVLLRYGRYDPRRIALCPLQPTTEAQAPSFTAAC